MPGQYYYITAFDSQNKQVWQAIISEDSDQIPSFDNSHWDEARWVIADIKQRGFRVTRRKFSTEILDEALENVPSQAE